LSHEKTRLVWGHQASFKIDDDETTRAEPTASVGQIPAQLRRRRAASWRLPPMPSCGHRDPIDCRNVPPGRSAADVRAARRAWRHLRDHGLTSEVVAKAIALRDGGDAR
jgi:hypothetical protein